MSDEKKLGILDVATGGVKRALDIMFVQNPKGTSMGVAFGVVMNMAVKVLEPSLKSVKSIDLSGLNIFYYIFTGVFLFNVRNLFRRQKLDPSIEEALGLIEESRRKGGLSKAQIKLSYIALLNKVVNNVQLEGAAQQKAESLSKKMDVPHTPA